MVGLYFHTSYIHTSNNQDACCFWWHAFANFPVTYLKYWTNMHKIHLIKICYRIVRYVATMWTLVWLWSGMNATVALQMARDFCIKITLRTLITSRTVLMLWFDVPLSKSDLLIEIVRCVHWKNIASLFYFTC